MGLEASWRREAADGQTRPLQLPEPLGADVLEPVAPEVAQGESVRQRIGDGAARRLRDQDLAAVTGVGDPRGAMDVETQVVAADPDGVTRVEPDPDPDRRTVRERANQRALDLGGCQQGVEGRCEDGEERVAAGGDFDSAVRPERRPHDGVVHAEDLSEALTERCRQLCAALDVAEEEGQGNTATLFARHRHRVECMHHRSECTSITASTRDHAPRRFDAAATLGIHLRPVWKNPDHGGRGLSLGTYASAWEATDPRPRG
jgi:hypothetical protein